MLDHLSIRCADMAASAAFYDAVLAPLAGRRVMDFGETIGFGVPRPRWQQRRSRLPRPE
jgi:catechol 2,3-dioxygenase-like lactoylglutathione lyase family enzyme